MYHVEKFDWENTEVDDWNVRPPIFLGLLTFTGLSTGRILRIHSFGLVRPFQDAAVLIDFIVFRANDGSFVGDYR